MKKETKELIEKIKSNIDGTKYRIETNEFYIKKYKAHFVRIIVTWERSAEFGVKPIIRKEWVQFDEYDFKVIRVSDPDIYIVMWLVQHYLRI